MPSFIVPTQIGPYDFTKALKAQNTANVDSGLVLLASNGPPVTLKVSGKNWSVNMFADCIVEITGGAGLGQIRKALSNTSDTLVLDVAWTVVPDPGNPYRIGVFGKMASDIATWGGVALTGRDVSKDLANLDITLSALRDAVKGGKTLADINTTLGTALNRNIAQWGGVALTGRDITGDLAHLDTDLSAVLSGIAGGKTLNDVYSKLNAQLNITLASLRDSIAGPGAAARTLGDLYTKLNAGLTVTPSAPVVVSDGGGALTVDGAVTVTGAVGLAAQLPAGTNNIGDIDVLSEPATAADAGALPAMLKVIAGYDGGQVRRIITNASGRLQVDLFSALPAGDANIGNVDVLTLPALPAGVNNIGSVNVAQEPGTAADGGALPGALKVMGAYDGGAVRKLLANAAGRLQVDVVAALPAGGNNIGGVNVLTFPSLPTGTNNIGDVDILTEPATAVAGAGLPAQVKVMGGYDGAAVYPVRVNNSGFLQTVLAAGAAIVGSVRISQDAPGITNAVAITQHKGRISSAPVTGVKTVTTVVAELFAGASRKAGRSRLTVRNRDAALRIRIGPATITDTTGFGVDPGAVLELDIDPAADVPFYAVSEAGNVSVEVLEA